MIKNLGILVLAFVGGFGGARMLSGVFVSDRPSSPSLSASQNVDAVSALGKRAVIGQRPHLVFERRARTSRPDRPFYQAAARASAATKRFEENWRAAIEWSAGLPEQERLWVEWAFVDRGLRMGSTGEEAKERLEWIKSWMSDEKYRGRRAHLGRSHHEATNLTRMMAREDPVAAVQWAREHLGGRTLGMAISAAVAEAVEHGTDSVVGAVELVETLPPGGIRRQVAGGLLERYATENPAAALRWAVAEERISGRLSKDSWQGLASKVVLKEGAVVRDVLADSTWPLQENFAYWSMWHMVDDNAQNTMDWARGIDGARGEALQKEALKVWRQQDATAVEAWEAAQALNDDAGD